MAFLRQTWALILKNWKIISRHSISAVFIALILPIALTTFFSFAKNLFVPPAVYGVSDPRQIRSLPDALSAAASAGRETVVLVNNGLSGGDIDRVIDSLAQSVESAGKKALRRSSTADLGTDCRSNLRGVSRCYGAVVFKSSPTEGSADYWNYTLRSDGALRSMAIDVDSDSNDAQIYLLPLQRAVDAAIASVAGSGTGTSQVQQGPLPDTVDEYPFTSMTQEERAVQVRIRYQSAITNWMGVAFMTSVIFITYHLTGFIATERESGMTRLLDAMMPVKHRWHAQAARIISCHFAFVVIYIPGWVIGSLVLRAGVFANTSVATVLVYHLLNGIAMGSYAILVSSLFRKAQISGIAATLSVLILGILAQSISYPSTAAVGLLSFLFTPCNYVYFITYMARYERDDNPADLTKVPPGSPWNLTGIVLWVFLIIQIFAYPLLGAILESKLHGTTTKGRNIVYGSSGSQENDAAVRLEGFTKTYKPSALRRMFSFISPPAEPVVAVNSLTLDVRRGQILALLGANGSGKSTTLDSIAGTNKLTSGSITIDGTGGLGIAPQKNVLWDELTVEEHIKIFNRLKAPGNLASKQEIRDLIKSVDLELKRKSKSKTLSGGQKRKLQLGMMLTGGSAVCCVDEVSSGIDPLSRRKIWDILLAERGRRTIVLTTHFLDEADLLADHIAILSKGTLRADGSSVELKDRLGGGYRVHVHKDTGIKNAPDVEGVQKKISFDLVSYIAPSSALAAQVIRTLEANDIHEYRFSGPTIEDVFLQLAEEVRGETGDFFPDSNSEYNEKKAASNEVLPVGAVPQGGLQLLDGHRIGYMKQAAVLFRKRLTILKTNWIPHLAAFVLPVAAAGLVTLFIKGQTQAGCAPSEERSLDQTQGFSITDFMWKLVLGPSSKLDLNTAATVLLPVFNAAAGGSGSGSGSGSNSTTGLELARQLLQENATFAETFEAFQNTVIDRRMQTVPGGLWLGDGAIPPTVAYMANYNGLINPLLSQNLMNMLLSNVTVLMEWAPFATPWDPDTGNSLQFLVYTGIALSCYPGFFALYPSLERRWGIRGLQYSNGVRPLPLWLAYLALDFIVVLASSALVTILWAALSNIWYHIGYIFLVFMLYGLTAILLAYVVSLFCKTQLSTYAWVAAGQAVMFLVYLVAYLCTVTYAPVTKVDDYLLVVHFVISAVAPIGSVIRTLFLVLNLFSTACDGRQLASNPGGMLQYGGPILYLILQSILLFIILLWADSGSVGSTVRRLWQRRHTETEDPDLSDEELANELNRVTTTNNNDDGLRVMHLTKTFGKNTAVDNVTFGIQRGEVFALLGPNGAGKSTTISLIRGDLKPSRNGGEILVEDKSVIHDLPSARSHLGVCPQHDAMDLMTVREHLEFYARVRGIPDIAHNVNAVIHAVGLQAFSTRMANALSGGNKRKLSLGIALMGNPTVLLLDEPSSGLDAAAKRIMWKTLAATVPGRSLLLTTHSMEEADALASRAGILAKRMLALGTTDNLRHRFGDALHVHLISKTAPHTTAEETERLRNWIQKNFPGAEVEEKTYHGQMRFSVPASDVLGVFGGHKVKDITRADQDVSSSAVGQLAVMLEEQRENLGIMHYSVSPTTLDQVFLTIVGKHNVKEEGYKEVESKPWWRFGL